MRSIYRLLLALVVLTLSTASFAQIAISVTFAPPALPVYEQPLCPGEGYIWTPGYWAYDPDYNDYYWVPGTWVLAPEPGLLWTPPYWAWNGAAFVFYDGYWGPQVGFYGGIVYGFGYFGVGYQGGYWQGGQFYYNRAVNNVNVTVVHNVYNTTVVNNTNVTRVSYNGGAGGTTARPTPEQEAAARQTHVPPTAEQTQHAQTARSDPQLRASTNHGKPPVAATAKPGTFSGQGVVKAKEAGAPYQPPANPAAGAGRSNAPAGNAGSRATHPNELPPLKQPAPANAGNFRSEQKEQKEQENLYAKQQKDRQKLEQKQEQEHQKLAKQSASDARKQQLEQKHQQETQQLQQREQAEQQKLQQRQGGGTRSEPHP
jgi:WXXGXW repeat (2 copies)